MARRRVVNTTVYANNALREIAQLLDRVGIDSIDPRGKKISKAQAVAISDAWNIAQDALFVMRDGFTYE